MAVRQPIFLTRVALPHPTIALLLLPPRQPHLVTRRMRVAHPTPRPSAPVLVRQSDYQLVGDWRVEPTLGLV